MTHLHANVEIDPDASHAARVAPGGPSFPAIVRSLETLIERQGRFATIYADPPWPYANTTARGAAENHYRTLPLLGVRGNLPFRDRTCRSWLNTKRTVHSHKPFRFRALIERVSPGPYLELYGREEQPNTDWTVYGNQVERRLF